ncbi:hypothetical protein V6C32_10810 [Desulforamulus ruminis]|uniref:hypothetical protein n=1 Tax=Desulforamulus ruminis TaxID=1564 RepID=UPI002FDAAA56
MSWMDSNTDKATNFVVFVGFFFILYLAATPENVGRYDLLINGIGIILLLGFLLWIIPMEVFEFLLDLLLLLLLIIVKGFLSIGSKIKKIIKR